MKFPNNKIFNALENFNANRKLKYAILADDEFEDDNFIPPEPKKTHPDTWDYCLCEFVPGKPVVPIPIGSPKWNRFMEKKYKSDEYAASVEHYIELDEKQEFYYDLNLNDASNLLYRDGPTPGKYMVTRNLLIEKRGNKTYFTLKFTLLFLDVNGRARSRNIVFEKLENRRRFNVYGVKTWHVSITSLIRHMVESQIIVEGTPLTHTFRKLR